MYEHYYQYLVQYWQSHLLSECLPAILSPFLAHTFGASYLILLRVGISLQILSTHTKTFQFKQ